MMRTHIRYLLRRIPYLVTNKVLPTWQWMSEGSVRWCIQHCHQKSCFNISSENVFALWFKRPFQIDLCAMKKMFLLLLWSLIHAKVRNAALYPFRTVVLLTMELRSFKVPVTGGTIQLLFQVCPQATKITYLAVTPNRLGENPMRF